MKARFRVFAQLDLAGAPVRGTVTIDRANGIFSVRPHKRRRLYALPLDTVATLVCRRLIMVEIAERRAAKRRRRG